MKVTKNALKMCYEVYCDTDSDHTFMSNLMNQTVEAKQTMKQHLNSIYGKVIMNMNKDYIVVHEQDIDKSIHIGIIFKDKICSVLKSDDGITARIILDNMLSLYTKEKYEDIIKQLI